jgi:hypothetical protein
LQISENAFKIPKLFFGSIFLFFFSQGCLPPGAVPTAAAAAGAAPQVVLPGKNHQPLFVKIVVAGQQGQGGRFLRFHNLQAYLIVAPAKIRFFAVSEMSLQQPLPRA